MPLIKTMIMASAALALILWILAGAGIKRAGKRPADGMTAMLAGCLAGDILWLTGPGLDTVQSGDILTAYGMPVFLAQYIFLLGYTACTAERSAGAGIYTVRPVIISAAVFEGGLLMLEYFTESGLMGIDVSVLPPVFDMDTVNVARLFYIIAGLLLIFPALQFFILSGRRGGRGLWYYTELLLCGVTGSCMIYGSLCGTGIKITACLLTASIYMSTVIIEEYDARVFRLTGAISRKNLDQISLPFVIMDRYHKIAFIGESAENEIGITSEACIGISVRELADRFSMPLDLRRISETQEFTWTGSSQGRLVEYKVTCRSVNSGRAYIMLFEKTVQTIDETEQTVDEHDLQGLY